MTRLLILLFCVAPLAAAPADVLFVAANDSDLQPILGRLASPATHARAAWITWSGTFQGKTIALARSEGDPLNAVAVTTLALRRHQPKLVIVFGVARAHDPALRPGDVVFAERFVAFDGMISPHLELEAGSDSLKWQKLLHPMMTAGEKETRLESFPASTIGRQLAAGWAPVRPGGRVHFGTLGSAHQVNREADRVAWLHREWGTSTEDGESGHVAGCALLFATPVVGARVVDGAPEEVAALALRLLEALP